MKHLRHALLLAAISTSAAAATDGPAASLAAFYAALASGDKATALGLLAPDATIYESGYVDASRDAYASHHLGEDIAFSRTTTRTVRKHIEKLGADSATILEETETVGTFAEKAVHSFGTETAVLEKKGNEWRITHIHWSSRKAK